MRRRIIISLMMVAFLFVLISVIFFVRFITKDKNKNIEEINAAVEEISEVNIETPSYEEEDVEVMLHNNKSFKGYELATTDNTYVLEECDDMQSLNAILVDAGTGEIICHNDGFEIISPASMTKVMTVLVAAEHLNEDDLKNTVTISEAEAGYSFKYDLSSAGFEIGEVVTIEDLFYGTVLPSGADAAMGLARYIAGDEASFVELMNQKAEELGLHNTHFTNISGMYNDDHYSTCAEIAIIMKAALENDFCYEVLSAHTYTTTRTEQHPDGIELSNWFLRRIEDKEELFGGVVLCAKTGYVRQSGNCAVSYEITDNGDTYICVTVNAHSVWRCIYDQVYIYNTVR